MATKTKESVGEKELALPKITKVSEMPKPRRGRQGMDLSPLEDLLKNFEVHAIEDIEDKNKRELWARRIRTAAANIGLEASTTYNEEQKRLYFQGFKQGEAPARGRRSLSTRNSKNSKETK